MPDNPHSQDNPDGHLRIWQQNVNRSSDSQLHLLHSMHSKSTDIIAIQEPYINFLGLAQATPTWITVYPTNHGRSDNRSDSRAPRAILLMNKTTLSSNAWTQIDIPSLDVVAVQVVTGHGTIRIFNIYNDCEHDRSLDVLQDYMRTARLSSGLPRPMRYLWLGDFNRHSPIWDEDRNHHLFTADNLKAADVLINLATQYHMHMTLPPGLATLEALATRNRTRVDNVYCDEQSAGLIDICTTREDWRPVKTDHFPIITHVRAFVERTRARPRYDYRLVDWDEFNETLAARLKGIPNTGRIHTTEEADGRLRALEDALRETVNQHVPCTTSTPYSKRWWTRELTKERKEVKRMARKARAVAGMQGHPDIERYRIRRNEFAQAIRSAKQKHWNEWLSNIDQRSIWDAHRFTNSEPADGGSARIPVLRTQGQTAGAIVEEASSNDSKAHLFHQMFFPARPLTSSVPAGYAYPEPKWIYQPITDEQIHEAILHLKPWKASKPGTVPNVVLIRSAELLVPLLGPLFRATDELGWYPQRWRDTYTLVIKKPGKTDYTIPGAWRPVVLSDTFARLLNKCKTIYLTEHCEKAGLLQRNHFGGRPGRSTVDSIHTLVSLIKNAWRKGKVAAVLFLDVKGAFPSVAIDRLAHEMRDIGIPKEHVEWMMRRLEGRRTKLTFDDFQSQVFPVDNGLDQGDPISGISYMIYNGGLLDCADEHSEVYGALFIDDAYFLAVGDTIEDAHEKIKHTMEKQQGVFQWAEEHNCEFGLEKFQLVDFTRRRVPDQERPGKTKPMPRPDLTLRGHRVKASATATFLGVRIDQELRWKAQGDKIVAKGQAWVAQIRRIARTSGGVAPALIRRLYSSVAIPRIFYAADAFLVAGTRGGQPGGAGMVAKLMAIQRKAAIAITGALRTTAADTLNMHANLLPIPCLIDKLRACAALRMATLPTSHPLAKHIRRAAGRRVKRHPAPLHGLMHDFQFRSQVIERVDPNKVEHEWRPGFRTLIASSREEGIQMDQDDHAPIQIYTDGSGYKGKVGAAAVLYRSGRRVRSLRIFLGSEDEYTVATAEGVALLLALELLKGERGVRKVTIAADNVGVIHRSRKDKAAPMQFLWWMFRKQWDSIRKRVKRIQLTVRWVPGHEGVEGNEEADRLAKRAITHGSSAAHKLPYALRKPLPVNKQAVARRINLGLKQRAVEMWRKSPRRQRMDTIDKYLTATSFLKLIEGLNRHQSSLLIQFRTGHCALYAHLHRIGAAPSPMCPACRRERETVVHFLLQCPAYTRQRRNLIAAAGHSARFINKLLNTKAMLPHLFAYIKETGRFAHAKG